MGVLTNIKKIPYELASILARDPIVCALILNDTVDALDDLDLTHIEGIDADTNIADYLIDNHYITLAAPTDTAIRNFDRNTFIIINLDTIAVHSEDDNISVDGSIYLVTDDEHRFLSLNRIRLLELADQINDLLDNRKISSAGTCKISNLDMVIFSEFKTGYQIAFNIKDLSNKSEKGGAIL